MKKILLSIITLTSSVIYSQNLTVPELFNLVNNTERETCIDYLEMKDWYFSLEDNLSNYGIYRLNFEYKMPGDKVRNVNLLITKSYKHEMFNKFNACTMIFLSEDKFNEYQNFLKNNGYTFIKESQGNDLQTHYYYQKDNFIYRLTNRYREDYPRFYIEIATNEDYFII